MSIENNLSLKESFAFDESKFKIKSRTVLGEEEVPTMIRVLVKKGIVKNENQAVIALLSVVVVVIVATAFFVNKSISVPPATINPALMSN